MSEVPANFTSVAIFAAIAALVLWLARKYGYFKPVGDGWKPDITLWHVAAAFGVYFGFSVFLLPMIAQIIYHFAPTLKSVGLIAWLSLINSTAIFLGLAVVWFTLSSTARQLIWRNPHAQQTYGDDFKIACITWCIGFPLVLFMSQLLDYIVFSLFHITQLPDQVAVMFVKMTFSNPLYFFLAIISIVVLAPLVEELLFRGFLQSFIRKHLGSNQAILVTSLCFAFFHFSPEQGLGNIPIVGSLFSLALFLGYIYERQQSLFASMCLHALFNTISVLNLYFLGGAPRGAL